MSTISDLNGSKYNCLLFDMDDTLYPLTSGLNMACRKNIQEYMLHHLGIEECEVPKLCLDLYKEYGTTMAGLKALGYEFDNDAFHEYIHGNLPYDQCLKPDPVLRALLLSMPQRKLIFTNADKAHASRVLTRLGLEDCFQGIICFETLNPKPPVAAEAGAASNPNNFFSLRTVVPDSTGHAISSANHDDDITHDAARHEYSSDTCPLHHHPKPIQPTSQILCKPSLEAIKTALRISNIDSAKTLFFDDSARNIAAGKAAGLHTVIVGSSELVPGADYTLTSMHNVKEALPDIWQGAAQGDQVEAVITPPTNTAVETAVLA